MHEPVMITSGHTFEKDMIEYFFKLQQRNLDMERAELEDEFNEENHGIFCPITCQLVDPSKTFPNKRIKTAIDDFLHHNKWAFEFNPKDSYKKIKITVE